MNFHPAGLVWSDSLRPRRFPVARFLTLCCLAVLTAVASASPPTDLDRFMERVLARRDDNWKKLQQYILDEREVLQLDGPGGAPLYGFVREYSWFVKEGFFVRSPVKADGVAIGEAERRRYEADWLARARRREERATAAGQENAEGGGVPTEQAEAANAPATVEDVLKQSAEPQFVSAAYFLKFKFDPGRYALAGRDIVDGRSVLRIEYYPTKLFGEGRTRPNRRLRDSDDQIEAKMNKVSLITLWVTPDEHQIVQYTFDNIDMDFLPGRSFVRVDEVGASMRMSQPFPSVWLPRDVEMRFRMSLASGSIGGRYHVEYHDYRLAEVSTRVR